MEFTFKPIAEDVWDAQNELKEGPATFKIMEAIPCQSKSGNAMIKLILEVNQNGFVIERTDYMVLIDSCLFKIVQLCKATDRYETLRPKVMMGKLDTTDLENATGRCLIKSEPYEDKQTKENKIAMKVGKYLPYDENKESRNGSSAVDDLIDDEIPF